MNLFGVESPAKDRDFWTVRVAILRRDETWVARSPNRLDS